MTTPLNFTGLLPQRLIPQTQGVKADPFKKLKQTRTVPKTMGRQRNKPHIKGKRNPQKEC